MAEQDIIQNLISRLGQSQADRLPPELGRHFFDVDERSPATLLSQAAAFAKFVQFYAQDDETVTGDWSSYFPSSDDEIHELLKCDDGSLPPHLSLIATFLRLYRFPQESINALTGKHLDFQFQDVLRFTPRPAIPHRAHILVELKTGAAPTAIRPSDAFSAGKDDQGRELIYRPVREVIVNHGQVADLRSIFRDDNRLRFAPIANSSDGLGGVLDRDHPSWPPFGHVQLPDAQIGFALASPVLRMAEGPRTIQLELQLAGLDPQRHTEMAMTKAFAAHVSGPNGWFETQSLSAKVTANRLTLTAIVSSTQPAIIDYDAGIHGHVFAAQSPVLQLLLRQDGLLRYQDLAGLTLNRIRIRVVADRVKALDIENDFGKLSAKNVFQPFGPQPVAGSRFFVGCDEALSKHLNSLAIKLTWQGAPPNLLTWYQYYDRRNQMRDGVSARIRFQDRSGQLRETTQVLIANASTGESILRVDSATPAAALQDNTPAAQLVALSRADTSVIRDLGQRLALQLPIHRRPIVSDPPAPSGFITISLVEDFLHPDYRKQIIRNAMATPPISQTLNEPYTPAVQSISLSYQAESSEVDVNEVGVENFSNSDVQFFHVGCFGQMREHAFLRERFAFLADNRVRLLPDYPNAGELLIGVKDVAVHDSVSLLLQAAEGSGDPDLPAQTLSWSVLSDNYWRPLTSMDLALDTSHHLRGSGIVVVALPEETTTQHSLMPADLVWLRAAIPAANASACRLIHIACNAVEVQFADQSNDPAHLASHLPANRITKQKSPDAAIKSVSQPFAGFGGMPRETVEWLTRRGAERLRHRNRCLTAWDYERMLLEAFPGVHKVKCIPHASEHSWLAPGSVLLVVVPDLRNQNAVDPFRPRVDTETLSRMTEFVRKHCGVHTRIQVRNPRFERVRLAFQVQFMPGLPFNFYRRQLHESLVQILSPWACDASQPIQFGGRVFRSVLLDLVEKLAYIDFVSDFRLLAPDSAAPDQDLPSLQAHTPDAILVSDTMHAIEKIPGG